MTETEKTEMGRLCFRVEGKQWNCYWAPETHTMEGAVLIGSILFNTVVENDGVKQAFMDTMRLAFENFSEKVLGGGDVEWQDERPSPEHERAGHA